MCRNRQAAPEFHDSVCFYSSIPHTQNQITYDVFSRIVSAVIRRHLKSQQAVFDVLLPIAEQRCRERDQRNLGQETPHHVIFFSSPV